MKIFVLILFFSSFEFQEDYQTEIKEQPEDIAIHIRNHMPYFQAGHGPTR